MRSKLSFLPSFPCNIFFLLRVFSLSLVFSNLTTKCWGVQSSHLPCLRFTEISEHMSWCFWLNLGKFWSSLLHLSSSLYEIPIRHILNYLILTHWHYSSILSCPQSFFSLHFSLDNSIYLPYSSLAPFFCSIALALKSIQLIFISATILWRSLSLCPIYISCFKFLMC